MGVLIVAALAGVALVVVPSSGARGNDQRHAGARTRLDTAVVVLNAGQVQGAATRLARRLERAGVSIAGVGNFATGVPSDSLEILYPSGLHAQAQLLSLHLAAQRPLLEPIYPAAAAAAGGGRRLVVVLPQAS